VTVEALYLVFGVRFRADARILIVTAVSKPGLGRTNLVTYMQRGDFLGRVKLVIFIEIKKREALPPVSHVFVAKTCSRPGTWWLIEKGFLACVHPLEISLPSRQLCYSSFIDLTGSKEESQCQCEVAS
jgi:hypothetical protein